MKPITTPQHHSVRVSDRTHRTLVELAHQRKEPISAILERAVERYRREQVLEEASKAWARVLADPVARAEVEAEDALWDGARSTESGTGGEHVEPLFSAIGTVLSDVYGDDDGRRRSVLRDILTYGDALFIPGGFAEFLITPLPEFGDRSALSLIVDDGAQYVLEFLAAEYDGLGY